MKTDLITGKLLVCDMDGTLLNSRHKLDPKNLEAVRRFVAKGGLFTVATGRNEYLVEKFIPELPVNVPAIIYNGAGLYDFKTKRMLWKSCLDEDISGVVDGLLGKYPGLGAKIYHSGEIYLVQSNDIMEAITERERLDPVRVDISSVPKPWYKVMFAWYPESLRQVEADLTGLNPSSRYVYSEPEVLEILSSNASKGKAMAQLLAILGLSKSHVVAVGDNLNDLEMLELAGTGIAVSNAHDGLKSVADRCCCHHDDNAVAQVIEWIEKGSI